MKLPSLKKIVGRAKAALSRDDDRFLAGARGVIHVGANSGQERQRYAKWGLRVIWIEPIPEVFAKLRDNLRDYPDQRAFEYLVTDVDGKSYEFKIASNNGASSSILDFKLHQDIWPEVHFEQTLSLHSVTLPSLLEREAIAIEDYDALVMDTQGSELLVLKGAESILPHFRYIKTEAPDFESYAGCCLVADLSSYLSEHNFREIARNKFAEHDSGGSYYDVIYERNA